MKFAKFFGDNQLENKSLKLVTENVGNWKLYALEFHKDKRVIKKWVSEKLSNIQTDGGQKIQFDSQSIIATEIKAIRGKETRDDTKEYAISLGLKFSRPDNPTQHLDIDNYIKPIFAGIATGLFSPVDKFPIKPEDFKEYNDSCFRYLYVQKLGDLADEEEGVAIVISEKQ